MTPEQRKHKVQVTLGQISDILDEALRDARNEALEEAAAIAIETLGNGAVGRKYNDLIAKRIRSLKSQDSTP